MEKYLLDQIIAYFIGSLAITIIEDLLKLNDPETIEKFNTELKELLNK